MLVGIQLLAEFPVENIDFNFKQSKEMFLFYLEDGKFLSHLNI